MKHERGWLIPRPVKQEAIDLRDRNLAGLRHGDELSHLLLTRRKELKHWPLAAYSMVAFKMLHEEWLAEQLRHAMTAMRDCIEATPGRVGGVPVFRGTRFSVSQLIAELADSDAVHEVADNYEMDESLLRKFLHALAVYINKPAHR